MDRIMGHLFPYLAFGGKYNHFQESLGPAEFATISKTWQRTIEAMTFRRLGVLSYDDIPDAKYLLGRDPHRLASVERIDFLIKADDILAKSPYIRDQKLVFTTFTQELSSLTQLLLCPVVTSLAIYFKEELRRDFLPRDESFAPRKSREAGTALESGRKVPPAWIMNVLAKFPLAQQVDYEIFNFIMCRRGQLRTNMQQELCTSLGGPAFTHLSNLSLWFGPNNFLSAEVQSFLSHKMIQPPPSMSRGTHATDSLNSALRTLSQQLQELHIHGLFSLSPDLFINRADDDDDGNIQPFWPRLRVLRVTTTLLTPCGSKWLIPPHRFGYPRRWKPTFTINATLNSATIEFNKLMTALSHGMLGMPRLQLLTLDFLVGPDEPNWDNEDVDWTGNWTGNGQVISNNAYVPSKTYELVRYVREDNERREMGQWKGGITEKPAEGYRFCTLAVFNDWFVAGNKNLYWSPFPEEAVENWNELHKRIKGLTDLEEWRRM
ncbi:hypothetical protein NEUTE1DRAFT_101283 [Neurospora tetrasperma FGSC 2508]|uniref:Uncharacterized protein n=1 Tax=Neurospora tetrasperma (strain FGSC 2508 / ATCC MYA-4615 / P0657) TaxID=510951 RepID=F8MLN9_NEUT8|nr:uncharacterized protein NEUTE1DRAFT_101283 [Neurospora tetrasperma FGSC 2508]EGO58458.1 hypothetical protein NEUTE1DRAFT_101283 [Neurospora tetrasperma FGSC 2508]